MPEKKRLLAADLLACKGKRQLVLTTAADEWTARAAEEAGVDMILVRRPADTIEGAKFVVEAVRRGAPNTTIICGLPPYQAYVSVQSALRLAGDVRAFGADIVYCSGLVPDKFAALAQQGHPCGGHVGYLPINDTWYGGPRAVGKTWDEAKRVYDDVMALDAAGCIAVEMECVPAKVAAEISKRTKMLVFSMGSGPHCDGQFIFAADILGTNSGHYPRHSITYAHLLQDAAKAFGKYCADVSSGAYPGETHGIEIKDEEFARFMEVITEHSPLSVPPKRHMPRKQKLTVADLLALKGQRQLVQTTAFDEWTAKAAEEAGVDMILASSDTLLHTKYVVEAVRRGAPNTLIGTELPHPAYSSIEDALTLAGEVRTLGADIIYCSGLLPDKFAGLARQHYPCTGHVGYLPCNETWHGGSRIVGDTCEEAKRLYNDVMALEAAGCIAVQMECVPAKVAAEISGRTKMIVWSLGSGPTCDGQLVSSEDLLGIRSGRHPQHSITYAHMMQDAVTAFAQYREDVLSGAYPAEKHCIKIKDEEFDRFMQAISDTHG